MPTTGVDFYWPRTYYNDTSRTDLSLRLNSTRIYTLSGVTNIGNRTWRFDEYVYNWGADAIPGVANERLMKVVMEARNPKNKTDLIQVAGPTVTLVKTAEFPTPTPYSRASTTRSYAYPTGKTCTTTCSTNHGPPSLSNGQISGIVIGAIIVLVLILVWCGCCCCSSAMKQKKEKPTITDAEQAQMIVAGGDLMAQNGMQQSKGANAEANEALLGPRGRDESLPPRYDEIDPRTPHSVHELPSSYRP